MKYRILVCLVACLLILPPGASATEWILTIDGTYTDGPHQGDAVQLKYVFDDAVIASESTTIDGGYRVTAWYGYPVGEVTPFTGSLEMADSGMFDRRGMLRTTQIVDGNPGSIIATLDDHVYIGNQVFGSAASIAMPEGYDDGAPTVKTSADLIKFYQDAQSSNADVYFFVNQGENNPDGSVLYERGIGNITSFQQSLDVALDELAQNAEDLAGLIVSAGAVLVGVAGIVNPIAASIPFIDDGTANFLMSMLKQGDQIEVGLAMCPVELTAISADGTIYGRDSIPSDDYYYYEGDLYGTGDIVRMLLLRKSLGTVEFRVTPEDAAAMNESFSFLSGTMSSDSYNFSNRTQDVLIGEGHTFLVDFTPQSTTPEPASMLLLGSGVAGLAAWRRKKRA